MENNQNVTDQNKFKAISIKKPQIKNNIFLQSNKINYSKINLKRLSNSNSDIKKNINTDSFTIKNDFNKHVSAIIGYKLSEKSVSIYNNKKLLDLLKNSLKNTNSKKKVVMFSGLNKFSNLPPKTKLNNLPLREINNNHNNEGRKTFNKKNVNTSENIFIGTKSDIDLDSTERRYQAIFKIIKKNKVKVNEESSLEVSVDEMIMKELQKKKKFYNKRKRNKINELFKEVELQNSERKNMEIKKNKSTSNYHIKKFNEDFKDIYQNVNLASKEMKNFRISKEKLIEEYNNL